MGQKVHPTGLRLGVTARWHAQWYADKKEIAKFFIFDYELRGYLRLKTRDALVSNIDIARMPQYVQVKIYTAKPGAIIGKGGVGIEALNKDICQKFNYPIKCEVVEIKKPDLSAQIVANTVAEQLEKRAVCRRILSRAIKSAMKAGAVGIKIVVAGRINGVEMARDEWVQEGRVPLHTIKAKIDYAQAVAKTTYGAIGIKVYICTKDV